MGLIKDWIAKFRKAPTQAPIIQTDLKLAAGPEGPSVEKAIKERTQVLGRTMSYEFVSDPIGRNPNFTPPPYDLAEIARAADVEAYISQSIRKHREQILKEGYEIFGVKQDMVKYVEQRLFEISVASGITTDSWVRECITNLITYHTAYIVFRRDKTRSSGRRIRLYGKYLDPIAGIYIPDPTTMTVAVDQYGTPKKWRQTVDAQDASAESNTRDFNPEDVICITMDKKSGMTYGTPYILPALDDVRALRRLEEIALIVAAKEAFPLYHYKVGTPERPAITYEGGGSEVDEVVGSVQAMPLQGNIVTSERHEIKLISREGSAFDLSPLLHYFEARVLGDLRLSPIDLGRGGTSNKGTANTINKMVQDAARDYQQVFSISVSNGLILQLLWEGGYDINPDNMVWLDFPMIDREELRAHQNHGLQIMLGSAITIDEFRKHYLNMPPMSTADEADTTRQLDAEVEKELIELTGDQSAKAPAPVVAGQQTPAPEVTKTTTTKTGPPHRQRTVTKKITAVASNKGQPANQFGKKQAKTKIKANDYKSVVANLFLDFQDFVKNLAEDSPDTPPEEVKKLIQEKYKDFVRKAELQGKNIVLDAIDCGIDDACEKLGLEENPAIIIGSRRLRKFYSNFIEKSFNKVASAYVDQVVKNFTPDIDGNKTTYQVFAIMSPFADSINKLAEDQIITAERFGFAKVAKKNGYKSIQLQNIELGCSKSIELPDGNLVYKNLIPDYHEPEMVLQLGVKSESDSNQTGDHNKDPLD